MQNRNTIAFLAGIYYGLGIHVLTDITILLTKSLYSTEGFFEPCRYLGNTAVATTLVIAYFPQWKRLFVETGEGYSPYDWHLSLLALLGMGFAYGNSIVYLTEIGCLVYTVSLQYTLDRLLLAAPCTMSLVCFAELCGWNGHMRRWLMV